MTDSIAGIRVRAAVLAAASIAVFVTAPASAGPVAAWSLQPSPNPSTPQGTLSGVSCALASSCWAVGGWATTGATEQPLAERWDGSHWTASAVAGPLGAPAATLRAVSCPTPAWCAAAGDDTDASGNHRTLIESWNGSSWNVEASADPAGMAASTLTGVSCLTAARCTAVGSTTSADGTVTTLAEAWDGVAWTLSATPNPTGATHTPFTAVSCFLATACTAVGTADDLSGFAEHWDGTSWSLDTSAAPPGVDRSALNGVSCTSLTACIAVGLSASKRSGIFGPGAFAERWDGSSWTSLGALNPPDASSGSILSAVSCVSATRCTAVGQSFQSGAPERTLAEVWDGSAWTIQATPAPGNAVIVNLAGVSCATASACTAAGITARNSGVPLTLAEHLAAGKWTTDATVDQVGAQVSSLHGVSCPSAIWCMAVGTSRASTRTIGNYLPFAGAQTALSERYDGSSWHIEAIQNPPDGAGTTLGGVSCLSASACMAVGSYANPSGTRLPLTEGWDGRRWAIQQVATPANILRASLNGVSCTAVDACTAVGGFTDFSGQDSTLAERWDGRRWTIQPTPNPAGAGSISLGKVSCLSASACVAVGSYSAPDGLGNTRFFALAEHWDGVVWRIEPVPDPVPSFGATLGDDFRDVSCTSPNACTAVGDYTTYDRPYPGPTLAERWDGHVWTWQQTPNPPGVIDAFTSLSGISCGSATSCLAVGFSYNGTGTDSGVHTIGERWDGTTWVLDPAAEPLGAIQAELLGVSCSGPQACSAVGDFSYEAGNVSVQAWPGFTLTERYG